MKSTTHMSKLIIAPPVVLGVRGAMALFFYRSRAVSHASWTDSDLIVFGLPFMLGIAVSAYVLFVSVHG